jgi:hypothetical protein
MAVIYASGLQNTRMEAVKTAIDAGAGAGKIKILTSGDVLLATLTLSDPCGTVTTNVLTFSAITSDTSADATGTAAKATITTSADADVVTGLTVSTSGANINLNTTSIVSGATVAMTSGTLTHNTAG